MDWKIGARFHRVIFNNPLHHKQRLLRYKCQKTLDRCYVKIFYSILFYYPRHVSISWLDCNGVWFVVLLEAICFPILLTGVLTILTILSTSKFSPEQNTGATKHLNHNIHNIVFDGARHKRGELEGPENNWWACLRMSRCFNWKLAQVTNKLFSPLWGCFNILLLHFLNSPSFDVI